MNFSSTSSFQTGSTQNLFQRGSNNSGEVGLKTSNPDIFPSLHPLSGMYRPTKTNKVNPPFAGHIESQGPVKKIKVDQGHQAVVLNANRNEYARTSTRQETQVKTKDQDVFRVPRLPKRLLDKKSKETQEQKPNDFTERLQGFQSIGESFLDTEFNFQAQPVQMNCPQVQIPFIQKTQEDPNRVHQEADPLLFQAFYERLQLEYYNFQLRQSLLNMYQLSQSQALQKMQQIQQAVRVAL